MIDDDELRQQFDELIETNTDVCYFCNCKLEKSNISNWKSFFKIDGVPLLVCQCVICQEVIDRMYDAQLKKIIVTEKQVRSDIKKEGWTVETLKAFQEKQNNIIH